MPRQVAASTTPPTTDLCLVPRQYAALSEEEQSQASFPSNDHVPTPDIAQPSDLPPGDLSEINRRILVEITLARERKVDFEAIRQAFAAMSISRIHRDFLRLGHPPRNIVFGRAVPAETAREAIRLAKKYNGGIAKILPERRFIPHYIGIGTSAFDELVQVPIAPADVERLADPSLSTEAFHRLYRCLTGEDRKGPVLPC